VERESISLSFQEVTRLEQSLVEGIKKYQDFIAAIPEADKKYVAEIYQNCLDDYKSLLADLTKLYPNHPRRWSLS
jgi:hypothetical protein